MRMSTDTKIKILQWILGILLVIFFTGLSIFVYEIFRYKKTLSEQNSFKQGIEDSLVSDE